MTISLRPTMVSVAGALALMLSACSAPAPMLQEPATAPTTPPGEGLEEFYSQDVEWDSCGSDFECAAVTVPIDYDNPGAATLEIHMKKYGLPGAEGMVFINPGGPGGSGIDTVEAAADVFTFDLRSSRQIVGFDPRGVGQSSPITCLDSDELDDWYTTTYDLETEAGWDDYLRAIGEYTAACAERNPDLIGFVDTVSAAKDMDIIRGALDLDTLDYLGFSYGTKLGATYADLFGARVGKFVLDGGVDLTLSDQELSRGQTEGFERAYRVFIEDCMAGPGCPFTGTIDEAYEETLVLIEELAEWPAPTSDPDWPATDVDLMNAIILTLYSTDNWGLLSRAIADLQDGDGDMTRFLSDFAMERGEDGEYAPGDGAMIAINCLDMPHEGEIDYAQMRAVETEFEGLSELFGPPLAYSDIACATFPVTTSYEPRAISAPDAPAMVVIGTTGDPATPYEWSQALADQLNDAVLLTWEGEGHTAYGKGSCIDAAVDAFLIDGLLPEDGLRC